MKHAAVVAVLALAGVAAHWSASCAADPQKVSIKSTLDGTMQPCYVILPDGFNPKGPKVPLLVSLHPWSHGGDMRFPVLERGAAERGWIFLAPHFRGRNNAPDACGSLKAQQDILDAVDWASRSYPVDRRRIYLTGVSGGGHMSMLMAGRHPEVWAGVSAWVGISDLAAWHAFHKNGGYGAMLRNCCGGAPGESKAADEEYRARSPLTWLHRAVDVPLDLGAGIHDGHTGSVPIRHTLNAFNVVAKAQNLPGVSEAEIEELSRQQPLKNPQPSDLAANDCNRKIYLRRAAGKARVTIFEGGHERLDRAALEWLSKQAKP